MKCIILTSSLFMTSLNSLLIRFAAILAIIAIFIKGVLFEQTTKNQYRKQAGRHRIWVAKTWIGYCTKKLQYQSFFSRMVEKYLLFSPDQHRKQFEFNIFIIPSWVDKLTTTFLIKNIFIKLV